MVLDPTVIAKVYNQVGGDRQVVASGGEVLVESGGTITLESGATLDAQAGVTVNLPSGSAAVSDLAVTTGSMIIGAASVGAELVAKTSGQLLLGTGTTLASVVMSGDATIIADGTLTVAATVKLTALVAAGLASSDSYIKTDDGVQADVLAASGAGDTREVVIIVTISETFADNTGTETNMIIGETDSTDKFFAAGAFTGAAAGDIFVSAGTLTAEKALITTMTAAIGDGDGGFDLTVLALLSEL